MSQAIPIASRVCQPDIKTSICKDIAYGAEINIWYFGQSIDKKHFEKRAIMCVEQLRSSSCLWISTRKNFHCRYVRMVRQRIIKYVGVTFVTKRQQSNGAGVAVFPEYAELLKTEHCMVVNIIIHYTGISTLNRQCSLRIPIALCRQSIRDTTELQKSAKPMTTAGLLKNDSHIKHTSVKKRKCLFQIKRLEL